MSHLADHYRDLIANQRREIRGWWIWVVLVGVAGGAILLTGFISRSGAAADWYKVCAGAFLAACGTFPYKNIPPRRERILTYQRLRANLENARMSEEDEQKVFREITLEALRETVKRGPNG